MTLDQLLILDTIASTGTMRAAAQVLYRTQPTLSVAIKKLEEEFDLEILSRDHHKATLTPAGHALHQKAKKVLQHAQELENLGKQLSIGEEPELSIAFASGTPMVPFMKILQQCKNRYPNTRINLSVENLFGSIERLLEHEADLAIAPWRNPSLQLESIPFLAFQLFPVASSDFPLAQPQRTLTQEEVSIYPQVILRDSSRNAPKEMYGVLEGASHWKVNDHHTKKEIILAGMGWGSLPAHMMEEELAVGSLIRLTIDNYPNLVEGDIRLVRRFGEPVGPVAQELWELFKRFSEVK